MRPTTFIPVIAFGFMLTHAAVIAQTCLTCEWSPIPTILVTKTETITDPARTITFPPQTVEDVDGNLVNYKPGTEV